MAISTHCRTSGTTLVFALCIFFLFSFSVFKISCFSSHHPNLAWLDYDHDAESLIEATRIPKIISSEAIVRPSNVHIFQNDGEVIVGTDAPRHPLFDVLENASSEWMSVLDAHVGHVSAHTRVFPPVIPCSPLRSKHMLFCSIDYIINPGRGVPSVRICTSFSVVFLTKFRS
jgi:hypothetical protein